MSTLLPSLQVEFSKLYSVDSALGEPLVKSIPQETHDFKTQLKKLKAHLNKHIQESESQDINVNDGENNKMRRRRELVVEKLNKAHKHWDHSIKKQIKHVSQQHNKFNKSALSKLYEFDIDKIYINKLPPDSKKFVDKAISFHISRYNIGNLSVRNETGMVKYLKDFYGISEDISSRFVQMGQIVQDMRQGDTSSCRAWCSMDSLLNFELYVLESLQLFKKGDTLKTYNHLTGNIPPSSFHQLITQVSPILTQLVLRKKIQDIDETIQIQLDKCISIFTKEYCSKNHLPFDSPLYLIVLSGVISFQFFIKYTSIRAAAHVDWSTEDELPFDVKLPEFLCHFHPIFICPVLKEETTKENPPYSLPCHHILSKKSLDRLSKNGTSTFKCPYCPVNASKSKTRKVNFVML